jgi:hypothetical protein
MFLSTLPHEERDAEAGADLPRAVSIRAKERAEIAAVMAEVGNVTTGCLPRKCVQCNGAIPRYTGTGRKRRETRHDARFCSKRCSDQARRSAKPANGEMTASDLSEMPVD